MAKRYQRVYSAQQARQVTDMRGWFKLLMFEAELAQDIARLLDGRPSFSTELNEAVENNIKRWDTELRQLHDNADAWGILWSDVTQETP